MRKERVGAIYTPMGVLMGTGIRPTPLWPRNVGLIKIVGTMSQAEIPKYLGKTGKAVYTKWRDIITARTGWKDEFVEQVALAAAQYEL